MFLSFIVPVYNTEKYLRECLQSLFAQNISYNDYEVICINDGSTDGSLAVLESYKQQYPNLVVINKENEGVALARNTGIEAAQGQYIWFVDSDDFIQSDVLLDLKRISLKKQWDRIVTGFYCFENQLSDNEIIKKNDRSLCVNSNQYDSVVTTSLFRLEYIKTNRIRFNYPTVADGEDTIFMYEYNLYSPTKIELNQPYYFYRHRDNSATTEKTDKAIKRKQISYMHNAKIMKSYYDQKCGDSTATANVLMNFLWLELFTLAHMSHEEIRSNLRELKASGLFPFRRPEACTLIKSYQTTRTDFVGKLFDKIYLNIHTVPGFCLMKCWLFLEKVKSRLKQ